ncbi:MAG: class I SAM-dependent methyltransferase [Candidatus Binatia bacterium]
MERTWGTQPLESGEMRKVDCLLSAPTPSSRQHDRERYDRLHAEIHDATRGGFLFGRAALIRTLALRSRAPERILEVGCGAGYNLLKLCETFPAAQVVGLEVSADLLKIAQRRLSKWANRVTLLYGGYGQTLQLAQTFDAIFFSYALSRMNPGWASAIERAPCDLTETGVIAVVDFHDSPLRLFKAWMRFNRVRLDGHLLPKLEACFRPRVLDLHNAYGGAWSYLLFIGEHAGESK